MITATTIGYGDFHPVTDAGKIFTMIYVVASIGVISSFIKEITRKQHDRTQRISKSLGRK
jgi:voltage-gated potassium channel